ncbi:MAG: 4a-hydroxytetrahydrobiopterin dehydratase [Immundisolibacter sp.]
MSALTLEHCTPLPAGARPLPPADWPPLLAQLDGAWQIVDGHHLTRRWRLPDFASGLALVNRIGALAEAENHHPDLLLRWGEVELTLWTHAVGGLSRNDFILAAHIDRLAP